MKKYNLGICSVTFRKNSPEEVIKAVSGAGLDCIEWGSDIHAPCDDEEKLKEIARIQNEYNIKCYSYGTYFYIMRDSLDTLPQYIKAAKILGASVLRLWCGIKGSAEHSEKEKDELFCECKKAAQLAEDNGVILCMENHPGSFTDTAQSSLELIEKVNSPHFKMYWQNINITGNEDVELALKEAKLLSPHTVNIHVAWWVNSKQLHLSEGAMVWEKYLSEFSDGKCLLLEFIPGGKIEDLPTEAQSLRSIVNSL